MCSDTNFTQDWQEKWTLVPGIAAQKGGQGHVRKVQDAKGRVGALKLMHPGDQTNSERRRRFAHEVKSLQLVEGQGVPRVLDENASKPRHANSALYFVQDWVDGETLAHLNTPLDLSEAIDLTLQLATIVQRCHGYGVVHRDIKPENLILSPDTHLYLVDFGIAWLPSDERVESTDTQSGQELGNRFLRLPELGAGSTDKHDPRSDVSFVTGILFYLLTGRPPRQLVDSEGNRPHERSNAGFRNETSGDPRFPVGIVSLFQANFSIELNKRQASMDVLAKALSALAYPEPIDMSKYQQQEAAYQAAIRTARNMQESSVYKAMKDACDALVEKLRISCPATNPTLIEASLAGGAQRQGNNCYNKISIRDKALGIRADGSIIARRESGLVKGLSKVGDSGVRQFYEGPEGDVVGLIDAFDRHAADFLGDALAEHTRILQNRPGGD